MPFFLIFFLFLSKKKKCFSTVYYSRFIVTQDYAARASDIKLAHCQQLVHQLQVHSLVGVAHFRQPLCPGAALLPPASLATLDALVCVPNQQIQASSMPGSGAACPAQTCVETFLNAYRPAQHFLAQPRGAHVYGFVNKAPHARHQHANLWAQAASPVLHIHIATTFVCFDTCFCLYTASNFSAMFQQPKRWPREAYQFLIQLWAAAELQQQLQQRVRWTALGAD